MAVEVEDTKDLRGVPVLLTNLELRCQIINVQDALDTAHGKVPHLTTVSAHCHRYFRRLQEQKLF
jgi:hypothetical protein